VRFDNGFSIWKINNETSVGYVENLAADIENLYSSLANSKKFDAQIENR
jgi:hypothetical protein